jgi:hypothetical protein
MNVVSLPINQEVKQQCTHPASLQLRPLHNCNDIQMCTFCMPTSIVTAVPSKTYSVKDKTSVYSQSIHKRSVHRPIKTIITASQSQIVSSRLLQASLNQIWNRKNLHGTIRDKNNSVSGLRCHVVHNIKSRWLDTSIDGAENITVREWFMSHKDPSTNETILHSISKHTSEDTVRFIYRLTIKRTFNIFIEVLSDMVNEACPLLLSRYVLKQTCRKNIV